MYQTCSSTRSLLYTQEEETENRRDLTGVNEIFHLWKDTSG